MIAVNCGDWRKPVKCVTIVGLVTGGVGVRQSGQSDHLVSKEYLYPPPAAGQMCKVNNLQKKGFLSVF